MADFFLSVFNVVGPSKKMQLDVEVSPSAYVRAQLELECTCSVPQVYVKCRLKVGRCIGFAVHTQPTLQVHSVSCSGSALYTL